ncbi:hypothetical protein FRAAL6849 [Frankia alni ACN14a]|uniref:Uncharacterized protein n=1 Tax=Frankia alni (strain DSM 45986 / CECT 9034 / ACN14a) TaxID=326424 RepID=Q0RAR8_FRAAA|nr:hypothetical protein FRAAL6849 [Frankia alni ACN14a]
MENKDHKAEGPQAPQAQPTRLLWIKQGGRKFAADRSRNDELPRTEDHHWGGSAGGVRQSGASAPRRRGGSAASRGQCRLTRGRCRRS